MKTQITEHKDQNIFSCRFWELITSSAMGEIVENKISSAYVEFIEILQHQIDNSSDYKCVFRILADLEAMLSIHVAKKNRMGDTKKKCRVTLLHQACA